MLRERTPPLHPPRRSRKVGVALRHNSKQHGKRCKTNSEATRNPPPPRRSPTKGSSSLLMYMYDEGSRDCETFAF